jgi:hypothetical protein
VSSKSFPRFLLALIIGAGFAHTINTLRRAPTVVNLKRADFVRYCRTFANEGTLVGGGGGALSWRCSDPSDPAFKEVRTLTNLTAFCSANHGKRWIAVIRDLTEANGWACATGKNAKRERLTSISLSVANTPSGTRFSTKFVMPVVESPNLFLDIQGFINLRGTTQVRAFCIAKRIDENAPPLMIGIITPTGQRGYVRSDFTEAPKEEYGLPQCEPDTQTSS